MLYNFIITNTKKYQISQTDILSSGEKCVQVTNKVIGRIKHSPDIKDKILLNRLRNITFMLLNCNPNDIIMTKFVDKIWCKYDFFSDIGDTFLSFDELVQYYPYLKDKTPKLIAEKLLLKETLA